MLAGVFKEFRNVSLEYYGLDPCHYFRSYLILDKDMYQVIEKGMRGGLTYIGRWYSKAKNQYVKSYNILTI